MKNFFSIVLIITIISPLWLFYSIIQYEKYLNRKEIKKFLISSIDRNELVLLKFSYKETKTNLKWEHSKEFEYNGEMYDVVDKEITCDSVFYWCWRDNEETKLNKQLESIVKHASGNSPKKTERSQNLLSFLNSLFPDSHNYDYNFDRDKKLFLISLYLFNYTSQFIIPDTPPPKV